MRQRILCCLVLMGSFLLWTTPAVAGMPSVVLNDWAALRLETISFFVAAFLLCAALVRWLWNGLARDFPKFPRLSYRRAVAGVALWSMLMVVVLTMIAGTRELLTPGAWEKQGVLYRVGNQEPTSAAVARSTQPPAAALRVQERKEHLGRLQAALWHYAAQHSGRFPDAQTDPAIDSALWELPGGAGARYFYVTGRIADDSENLLVYEPELYGDQRWLLQTDGRILAADSAEIRRKLTPGEQP